MDKTSEKILDNLCINTIRLLSADAVEKAKSGHPGLPMGMAAAGYTMWMKHLRFNPKNPEWVNRDRFVLSAGHGSMLLYSLLHLTGFDVSLDDIKQFRQWESKTPGHPEYGLTPGVETTTGPLGQGFATSVGMAIAERFLGNRYNKHGHNIVDYRIYGIVSDGDLMEGISAEAASFAGGLKLGKLTYLYDSNGISIEGSTRLAFCEDTAARFSAYGWHVEEVADGNDVFLLDLAIEKAKNDKRPSLIIVKTHIGYGSPNKVDTAAAHGAPLGEDELKKTKENLGWPKEPSFYIPDKAREHFRHAITKGEKLENEWNTDFQKYTRAFPDLARELKTSLNGELPADWEDGLSTLVPENESLATREASGKIMQGLAKNIPFFLGGSADLASSNNTTLQGYGDVTCDAFPENARTLHFGVREHAMGAILNGLALSKTIIPFGGTFLIFSDYMRPAIRLAAIMKLRVIYILTHDSIGQGEDGTTHQPVEHLASLRAMPNMTVIRPADGAETIEAWKYAVSHRDGPTSLIFTRQKLPTIDRQKYASASGALKGGYILKRESENEAQLIIIATGSEVSISLSAAEILEEQGVLTRVVSMPSWELFEKQDIAYRESVLPPQVTRRLSIEAASSFGWERYVGADGTSLAIDTFGASAPGTTMMEKFGFSADNIVVKARELLIKS